MRLFGKLTEKQQEKEDEAERAVKVLEKAGIKARYVETFTGPTDIHPGYILID